MQGIYNYIPVYMVHTVAAVLYLQSQLHVMLYRPWNMFCTFTSTLPAVCMQCPIWLVSLIPQFRPFPVCCSGIVWVILRWFQLPSYYRYHFCFHISHALNFYFNILIFLNLLSFPLEYILSAGIAASIDMHVSCLLLRIVMFSLLLDTILSVCAVGSIVR